MKNYIIEDKVTGRTVASGLAKSKSDARQKAHCKSANRYRVIEATAPGIDYKPIGEK